MDVFSSTWLVNMLAKSSKSPKGRVLSLFDILSDWMNAPDIQLDVHFKQLTSEHLTATIVSSSPLVAYLSQQTKALGASHPAMLAEHIALIACNAAQQQMADPLSKSLMHAKKAAEALILSQTQAKWRQVQPMTIGLCACVFALSIAITWHWPTINSEFNRNVISMLQKKQTTQLPQVKAPVIASTPTENDALTAHDAAMMYAKFEQMRSGTCQYLEVLQIPDKHKAIYIENVVGGKLPNNLNDLATANHYLEKVRCNFTPMLMANSR